jgi:hypothetical protein
LITKELPMNKPDPMARHTPMTLYEAGFDDFAAAEVEAETTALVAEATTLDVDMAGRDHGRRELNWLSASEAGKGRREAEVAGSSVVD